MTAPFLLTAEMRLAEARGPKIVITGVPGSGKTYLLNTIPTELLAKVLFLDSDAGDTPVAGLPVASARPQIWPEFRDIACALGGPNRAVAANAPYGEAHYRTVMANPDLAGLADFEILFFDSLSDASRRCRLWAEQQPEAFTDRGKKDLRAVYGLVAREMTGLLQQMQHTRSRTIIFVVVLEKVVDDFGVATWRLQLEGQKTANVLPSIVDEVLTLAHLKFPDAQDPVRCFVTREPNSWALPGKDRSGKLDLLEPPDLGKLLAKLNAHKREE
jgi:hypothetical protein